MGKRNRRRRAVSSIDSLLLAVTIILMVFGLIMVFSSSAIVAHENYGSMYYFAFRQFVWALLSLAALYLGMTINYRKWAVISTAGMFFMIIVLAVVLIPGIGHSVGGARRWIRMGPVGFQPSEFAKVGVVIYMAGVMDRKFSRSGFFTKDLFPPLVLVFTTALLIYMQPDFGSTVLIIVLTVGMLFLGGVKLKYLFMWMIFFIPFLLYGVLSYGYRKERVISFMNPFESLTGSGFQLAQSLTALGAGGLTGVGMGGGQQKLFYLPEVHTDFIYAIIGQELGFVGTAGVLLLFMVFAWRGMRIAFRHGDYLARVMASGLTFLITFQAVINMGVVTGILPTKGLSLPFISFGGTSLFVNMLAVGIILNISRGVKK